VVARELPVLREVFGTAVRYATDVDGLAAGLAAALAGSDPARAAAGRALAASYSWDAAAAAHLRLYRRLVTGAPAAAPPAR
jgi:hypothetical protein